MTEIPQDHDVGKNLQHEPEVQTFLPALTPVAFLADLGNRTISFLRMVGTIDPQNIRTALLECTPLAACSAYPQVPILQVLKIEEIECFNAMAEDLRNLATEDCSDDVLRSRAERLMQDYEDFRLALIREYAQK